MKNLKGKKQNKVVKKTTAKVLNTNGFDKNPQNINRKGRPRKLVSSIIDEMKANGVEQVKSSHVAECYESLLNLTLAEVKEKALDESCPIFIRLVAKAMLDSKKGTQMIETMLDRAHGKAKLPVETTIIEQPLFPDLGAKK